MKQGASAARGELERLIHAHEAFAWLAIEVLDDASVPAEAKVPLAAAAHYGAEVLDLIPDELPAYGLVDDLFVLALGLEAAFEADSATQARYAERELQGHSLREQLRSMRERFYGFWEFCRQQTAGFFEAFREAARRDGAAVRAAREELAGSLERIARATAGVRLREEDVRSFLPRFRAFRPEDLA
ncbi:MAG: hypothetical protein KatS3mg102_1764 [Planctomycetota bacterium]|nr:MAG: hypothetical protein KatS3mg102_1764 [Planctomycetota bacterium]